MGQIVIKITIPDYEYKEWTAYEQDGVRYAMQTVRKEISDDLKKRFVRHFEIESQAEE